MVHVKYHEELDKQKSEILKMGNLAKGMLSNSILSLKDQDLKLADMVLAKRDKLSEMDGRIESDLLRIIALYQPVAKDMRMIACGLKMITYLTRIGRYGKDIAQVTHELANKPQIAKLVSIPYMGEIAKDMIKDCLHAFKTENISPIKNIAERDDSLDALRYSIFRECLTYMMEDQKNITSCTHYIMVTRYIERCGDHACKMAEKITYMVTGERIEIK